MGLHYGRLLVMTAAPQRSGGGHRVAIGGRADLLAAALAMSLQSLPVVQVGKRQEVDWWGDRQQPINTGRRAEKKAAALAKAEAKRARKAAKRKAATW